jgi:hypothetical protein
MSRHCLCVVPELPGTMDVLPSTLLLELESLAPALESSAGKSIDTVEEAL